MVSALEFVELLLVLRAQPNGGHFKALSELKVMIGVGNALCPSFPKTGIRRILAVGLPRLDYPAMIITLNVPPPCGWVHA